MITLMAAARSRTSCRSDRCLRAMQLPPPPQSLHPKAGGGGWFEGTCNQQCAPTHAKRSPLNAEPEQTQTRDCVFQKQVKGVADTLQAIPNGCANSLPHCSKHTSCATAATYVTACPCTPRECTQAWQQARCRTAGAPTGGSETSRGKWSAGNRDTCHS